MNYPSASGASPNYTWGQAGAMQRPSVYSPGFWQIKPGQDYVAGNLDQQLRNKYIANANKPAVPTQSPGTPPIHWQPPQQTSGQYNVGITDGRLTDDDISKSMAISTRPTNMPQIPGMAGASGGLSAQFGDLMRQSNSQVSSDMSRQGSAAQAALDLQRQNAMADSGLGLANLAARLSEANDVSQQPMRSALLRLLFGNV